MSERPIQWFPTEREASNFMDLHCASCAKCRTEDEDGCPVWEDSAPFDWVITPDGPKCTEFEEAVCPT